MDEVAWRCYGKGPCPGNPTLGRVSGEAELPMTAPGVIPLLQAATSDNFDPEGYLWFNEDVAALASSEPAADVARRHFESAGRSEHRYQLMTGGLPLVAEVRASKLALLGRRSPRSAELLETCAGEFCGYPAEPLKIRGDTRLPIAYDRISWNVYDPDLDTVFQDNPESLFLDMGAGLRRDYRSNVVYAEIAMLPSTDILCFGDALPFDDDTFDGVVSLAVLEHVPDPFVVAEQLVRVVNPGGWVVVDWPFLQPVHGYPNHYFNATEQGARLAFENLGDVATVESWVPPWLHPVFTLRWFLDEWQSRLPEVERKRFLDLSVSEILSQNEPSLLAEPWASALAQERQPTISAGTRLRVTKRS